MNETWILVTQFGGFGVIAILYVLLVRWVMKNYDCMKDQHFKAVMGFIETANDFNQVVQNHMIHETEAFQELTKVIEKLCEMHEKEKGW